MKTPYYDLVPKDLKQNLKFRREMTQLGMNDERAADEIWKMCSRDPLFYFNTFYWTYDPRKKPTEIPFITWDFQDETMMDLFRSYEIGEYRHIEKTRDMGVSWQCLSVVEHIFHFGGKNSFLFGSRKQEYVDDTKDDKALMPKLDFVWDRLPGFLRPAVERSYLRRWNTENGSIIAGESTNENFSRSGRFGIVLCDEFPEAPAGGWSILSAVYDTTRTGWFVGTPKGNANAFYELRQNPDVKTITLHWTRHPEKAAGLYTSEQDKQGNWTLKKLDKKFPFPADYPFIFDGKMHSPWYDEECRKRPHHMLIAQELDIDYLGSAFQFFQQDILEERKKQYVAKPFVVGDLDPATGVFTPNPRGGRLKFWFMLNADGQPPTDDRFIVTTDVSGGTGASNSAFSIGSRNQGSKVGEYLDPNISPDDLAVLAVALCKWLGNAFLWWEANGPGRTFGKKVVSLGYRRIGYHTIEKSLSPKRTDRPGWNSDAEGKEGLLRELAIAYKNDQFPNPSSRSYEEASQYVWNTDGTISHSSSRGGLDPSGARDQHGDIVICDGLLWKALSEDYARDEIGEIASRERESAYPPNSFGWRRARHREALEAQQPKYAYGEAARIGDETA